MPIAQSILYGLFIVVVLIFAYQLLLWLGVILPQTLVTIIIAIVAILYIMQLTGSWPWVK